MTESEIQEGLSAMQDWKLKDNYLTKMFEFDNFREAMAFMMRASFEAEDMNHHPEWSNVYNKVWIHLQTHDAGGITNKDFQLAQRIDGI